MFEMGNSRRNSARGPTKHLTAFQRTRGGLVDTSCGQINDNHATGIGQTQRFLSISRQEETSINLLLLETKGTNETKEANSRNNNNNSNSSNNKHNQSKSKRNFGLTRSFLVNYLRWASLCSCCDMLSIYTLLMFVLLLSSFIEAHQECSQPNGEAQPATATEASAVKLARSSSWTTSSLARRPAERTKRSASSNSNNNFAKLDDSKLNKSQDKELQQRVVSGFELSEPLIGAANELAAPENQTMEHYEILRVNKSRSSPPPRAPPARSQPTRPAKDSRHSIQEQPAGVHRHHNQGSQRLTRPEPLATKTTPSKPRLRASSNQRRRASETRPIARGAQSRQLELQESHWIPVTGNPLVGPQAASALLDYPHGRRQPELSLVYGQRRPNPARQAQLVGANNYAQNPHWAHRRPRFHNEPQDNEIGPPRAHSAGKLYKRVLLCDKTLVSLDYIRSGHSLGRPIDTNRLDEHEINEISDGFLDLENQLESSMMRVSVARANWTSQTNAINSNQLTPNQATNTTALNESSTGGGGGGAHLDRLPVEASNLIQMERRSDLEFWPPVPLGDSNQLLSDEDPLVRCDMWDLEKGLKSRKPPRDILRMAIKTDFDTVRDAINKCRQLSERTLPPEDETGRDGLEMIMSAEDLVSLFSMKRGLMPGTKWCGLGDQASQYNDLGPKHRIDICCRAHDHCPIRSKPFRNDYGILNIGLYTKSHCDCDADFYRCLREVRSRTADMLGNLYFNVMKLQCMREERLQVCREAKPIALGFERCIRYEDQSPIKTVFKFTTPPVAY